MYINTNNEIKLKLARLARAKNSYVLLDGIVNGVIDQAKIDNTKSNRAIIAAVIKREIYKLDYRVEYRRVKIDNCVCNKEVVLNATLRNFLVAY